MIRFSCPSPIVKNVTSAVLLVLLLVLPVAAETIPQPLNDQSYRIVLGDVPLADFLGSHNQIPLVSAHRGGPKPGFPENAIETFAEALRYGPMLIEMDARKSKDGVLFLMHDRTLDRTTTGKGLVADTPWATIRDLKLIDNDGSATDFAVPTLEEALQWGRDRVIFMLDIKRGVTTNDIVEAVKAADAFNHVVFIARSLQEAIAIQGASSLAVVNSYAPDEESLDAVLSSQLDLKRAVIWTGLQQRSAMHYKRIHKAGMMVAMGTLGFNDKALDRIFRAKNTPVGYLELYRAGVDIISTDRYWAVSKVLQSEIFAVFIRGMRTP